MSLHDRILFVFWTNQPRHAAQTIKIGDVRHDFYANILKLRLTTVHSCTVHSVLVCVAEQKSSRWKLDMMVCAAATFLALLLLKNYLTSSEGALSRPLNLSVELVDFKALVRWLPGRANPKGTRYTLEFIDIGHFSLSTWNQVRDCTNITSTQCSVFFNQRVLTEYFLRVLSEWKEERSEWTYLSRSFQPYEYTLLSAPSLTVWTKQHSIGISLSHPVQLLTDVKLRFSVDLFQVISNTAKMHITQKITSMSTYFVNLPPGNYCISASAFVTAKARNSNTTKCLFLYHGHTEGKAWMVVIGVFLLLSIAVTVLIIMHCYVKTCNDRYRPSAPHVRGGTARVLTVSSEELSIPTIEQMFTDDQDMDENSSQSYCGRVTKKLCGATMEESREKLVSVSEPEDGVCSQVEDEADQNLPPVCDLYGTAVNLEESDDSLTRTECRAFASTARTSFSDGNPPNSAYGQNTEIYNPLEVFDEENSNSFCYEKDSSEKDTDSLLSDFNFGSEYEPRPDPRWMTNVQFRSQH